MKQLVHPVRRRRWRRKRIAYHVTPSPRGGWYIRRAGERWSEWYPTKLRAVRQARVYAKAHPPGQVIVHGADGRIQTEWTYGDDPRHIPG